MARAKSIAARRVTPLARSVARAIAHAHETGALPGDLYSAVTELADVASVSVLARGIAASDEFRSAVDAIANRHLRRDVADRQLVSALRRIADTDQRNAVEVAHARVLELGELAHYYGGLASGLTLLELVRR